MMMNKPYVFKSSEINSFDIVKIDGKSKTFNLDENNNEGRDFILLYMYVLPSFMSHGIKVGMATCHDGETFWHGISQRIRNQEHELALMPDKYEKHGLVREVIYWGICLDAKNENFKDYNVHSEILSKCAGIAEKEQEWFINVPQEDLIDAFVNCRKDNYVKEVYNPRKEQQDCVDSLKSYFNEHPIGDKFLLNCKMRFGKSYTTYKYCEEANLNKVLILTFVPAVESSWREDLLHIEKDYEYYTDRELRKDNFVLTDKEKPFVVFLSLQNYLGKDNDNNTKVKIKKLQDVKFDLVIFDEYHFGAWNQRTQETLEDFDEKYQEELKKLKNPNVLDKFSIKTDKTICLSGTPFKALARGEFIEDNTFTYSYFDEQKNKYPNSEDNDFSVINPKYAHFPDMKILGYNMSQLFSDLAPNMMSNEKILNKRYFSLNQFFITKQDENYALDPEFVYEEQIKIWLEIIKGATVQGKNFPYSNPLLQNYIKHTLWLMPTVNSCIAMTKLLKEDSYFSRYQIINLSGNDVGSGNDAYEYLMNEIKASENTGKLGSIAITVNKLTIGVTVKPWFSVFVLKDLASPEQYFQAVFRVQTPLVINGEILKKQCFVYDFNIDRASALLLKYAKQYESEVKKSNYEKLKIAKLIVKYMPIFINGDMEHPISEQVFYQLAEFGDTSGVPLSKKITNLERTTRMADDEAISDMLNDKEVSDIIKRVFAHAKFGKNKTNTPPSPSPEGFDSKIRKKGIDDGHKQGLEDYELYIDFDDVHIQDEFDKNLKELIKQNNPAQEGTYNYTLYANGFKKGYESGVNAPIKKLQSGKQDGLNFVKNIKDELGKDIVYKKETSSLINNLIHKHLNDVNNIPAEYRSSLYKRWYMDSFKKACTSALKPQIKVEKGKTIEDANNVLRHILARLFEFLYISVYRETTFDEIFKNADPNVFLEAVGITKKDFEILNKYKIFQEDVLNNYIHEFFINESLGEKLDLSDENVRKQYRNSFDWFGFGITKDEQN